MGAFFFLLVSLLAAVNLFLEKGKKLLAAEKTQSRMATLLSKKLVIMTSNTCLFIGEISPQGNLTRVGHYLVY